MRKCINCGYINLVTSRYCSECRNILESNSSIERRKSVIYTILIIIIVTLTPLIRNFQINAYNYNKNNNHKINPSPEKPEIQFDSSELAKHFIYKDKILSFKNVKKIDEDKLIFEYDIRRNKYKDSGKGVIEIKTLKIYLTDSQLDGTINFNNNSWSITLYDGKSSIVFEPIN